MRKQFDSLKVCYVASPQLFSKGAYGVHAMEMCKAMGRLGIDFETVLPGSFRRDDIFEYYGVGKPFRLKSLPFTKGFGRQATHGIVASIYALANRRRFDIVLTRNIFCAALTAGIFKIPTVYDAHHPPVNSAAELLFRWFQNSGFLTAVSFNSGGLRDIFLKFGLDEKKTVVAHNGVETDDYENSLSPAQIREKLNLPTDGKIVCYCGNTYPGRGVELLIEIAAELNDTLFLIVGGRNSDNAPLVELAEKQGIKNFRARGFVPHSQVPLYLKAADLLTLPYTDAATIKGGTKAADFTSPMKLFEYMAAEKPIVAASIPTVLEVLEDGRDSVLVPPGSATALAEGIKKCFGDKDFSEKIAKKAREKVGGYTWKKRVEKILSHVCERMEK